jgi:hypothetical protein
VLCREIRFDFVTDAKTVHTVDALYGLHFRFSVCCAIRYQAVSIVFFVQHDRLSGFLEQIDDGETVQSERVGSKENGIRQRIVKYEMQMNLRAAFN